MKIDKMNERLLQLGHELGVQMLQRNWRVATAESCTGGGIATAITAIAGSSSWFDCGIVSYANSAKEKLLGVSSKSLDQYGAVSEEVVIEMVRGVLSVSAANLAVAVSGVAGPGGGSPEKPVGTVWFAWATSSGLVTTKQTKFSGDRRDIQNQAVIFALEGLLDK